MIPVRNIYHMLAYAWENTVLRDADKQLEREAFDNIYNLLTSLLLIGVGRLIRQGFLKGYELHVEDTNTLRGRLSMKDIASGRHISKRHLTCCFDEFTDDIIMNQILRTTLGVLTRCAALEQRYRRSCAEFNRHFSGVGEVDLSNLAWNRLLYNGQSQNYRMIVGICELLHNGLIPREEQGRVTFASYIKDSAMAKLYERFILNFYRVELASYRVYSGHIPWDLSAGSDNSLLPVMKTDIEIEGSGTKLIIDTKYYQQALVAFYRSETRTLISNNLYQIFAYVKNDPYPGVKKGMLLYPTVDYDLHETYEMSGNEIIAATVDLAAPFEKIRSRLLGLAPSLRPAALGRPYSI